MIFNIECFSARTAQLALVVSIFLIPCPKQSKLYPHPIILLLKQKKNGTKAAGYPETTTNSNGVWHGIRVDQPPMLQPTWDMPEPMFV
jgi:hypothetical protein